MRLFRMFRRAETDRPIRQWYRPWIQYPRTGANAGERRCDGPLWRILREVHMSEWPMSDESLDIWSHALHSGTEWKLGLHPGDLQMHLQLRRDLAGFLPCPGSMNRWDECWSGR